MRPFRNIWMLEELGLPYHHVPCRPWSRKAKSVHPLGKVPALAVEYSSNDASGDESKQFVTLESAAINAYLGDLARETRPPPRRRDDDPENGGARGTESYAAPTLVPPPATPERAKYDSLSYFVMTEIDVPSLWIHRKHGDLSEIFGEAPGALVEARKQFEKALAAVEDEMGTKEESYLLPSFGFSGVDILFAHCCFWAQQIGWLAKKSEKLTTAAEEEGKVKEQENSPSEQGSKTLGSDGVVPLPLSQKLEAYLKRCRVRPAFLRAEELRKNQVYEEREKPVAKL